MVLINYRWEKLLAQSNHSANVGRHHHYYVAIKKKRQNHITDIEKCSKDIFEKSKL